jgi:hypothetical protein
LDLDLSGSFDPEPISSSIQLGGSRPWYEIHRFFVSIPGPAATRQAMAEREGQAFAPLATIDSRS